MAFIDLDEIPEKEFLPGYFVRFVHTGNITLAYWRILKGSPLPEHSHPHEQVANVLEGQYQLVVAGEPKTLSPGEIAVIPSNVVHSGVAMTDCRLLDVFYPEREDYKPKE